MKHPSQPGRTPSPAVLPALITSLLAACAAVPPGAAPPATATATAPAITAASTAAQAATSAASAPSAPRPGAAPTAAPVPGTPPAFAVVTKDAQRADGFLPLWTKDDKTWLEIPTERLGKPFFFGNSLASGLGERMFLPGLMGSEQVVVLRRVGQTVQLIARNLLARAPAGTPLARAVAESYSDSLLAVAPLAAAPHAQNKALLVDAALLLGGDLSGIQTALETSYRMPYALDRANSSILSARAQASGTAITMRGHFAVPRLPAPPVMLPGAPPPNPAALPNPPRVVPDPRSLFLDLAYTLAPLPEQPMHPRRADQRVGYFTEAYRDFGDDGAGDRRTHLINRWRLEKKDPAAALSEPKEPIRVVMDRNIPDQWRAPIRAGILEWNTAFERAGWKNAIVVEQQAADAPGSTFEGTRVLAVRWFAIDGPGAVAVGPSQADPRTGEILRGAAIIPENWVRVDRNRLADTEPRLPNAPPASPAAPAAGHESHAHCSFAHDALEQLRFGHDLLAERGALDPKGPASEKFIADALTAVTLHEVGHALGLRHNFKASLGITRAQLNDPSFTARNGISHSVMDYNALNLALDGETPGVLQQTRLGAYDIWAIEYGYRDFPAAQETAALGELASRSEREPALAYGTDEDAAGIDPQANRFDLGEDPLSHARRQIKLARELLARTQARKLAADDDQTVYRRNLQRVLANYSAAIPLAVRYVGGTYTSRSLAGAGKPLLAPVPAARQREALTLVVDEVFASSSFRFDPALMSRLGVDHVDRLGRHHFLPNVDFSLPSAVLAMQRRALDSLMSDGLADAEFKVADRRALLDYAGVQQQVQAAIWSDLKGQKGQKGQKGNTHEIDSLRRNLQREHLKRLAGGLLRPANAATADVPAVHRGQALQLQGELKRALAASGWNAITRAHLADSLATLNEALRAPLLRQGV